MRRFQGKTDKVLATSVSLDPKWLSLSAFILQNSLLIIGMKACSIYSSHSMNQYITSTAVILSEILKFILSTIACYIVDAKCDFTVFKTIIYNVVMEEGADMLKLCVPALLYTIQNNLQYIIEEAPLFLVLYQAKIITTALFYSALLSRRLSMKEWACVIALALGVGMVESSQVEIVPHHASNITGIVAVIFACLTSGVAGVYFEKILKSSRSSIWAINMQMALLSAFFCTSVALTQDSLEIVHHGVFTGYNPLVLLSIALQAITGLAVALVVKYADNMYKSFGHSISVVFCLSLSSVVFEDTAVNETFLMGSFLVLASTSAYASITAKDTGGHGNTSSSSSSSTTAVAPIWLTHSTSSSSSGAVGLISSSGSSNIVNRIGGSIAPASYSVVPPQYSIELNHNASLLGTTSRERSKSSAVVSSTSITHIADLPGQERGSGEFDRLLGMDLEERGQQSERHLWDKTAAGRAVEMDLDMAVDGGTSTSSAAAVAQTRSATPIQAAALPAHFSSSSGVEEGEVKKDWSSLLWTARPGSIFSNTRERDS